MFGPGGTAPASAAWISGVFARSDAQHRYDHLLAEGTRDRVSALAVGTRLAAAAVTTLDEALRHVDAPDVRHTFLHLIMAAHQQIRLARAWSGR